jgi:hypothetical protein
MTTVLTAILAVVGIAVVMACVVVYLASKPWIRPTDDPDNDGEAWARSDRDDATEADLLNGLDALAATPPRDFEPPAAPEAPRAMPYVARTPPRIPLPVEPLDDGPGGRHRAKTAKGSRAEMERRASFATQTWGPFTEQFAAMAAAAGEPVQTVGPSEQLVLDFEEAT